ncbi:unnamed protein product [Rotaria sordida]|uniref:PDZ domain-containing protein n=1 Tax=Rotaria sordida TaxID=392033 RepID=A0A819WHY2_9BILA|nr:unnamed protein product [Rotaria sordida]
MHNIIFHRNHPNERLCLTLCYGITSKSTTNIYIQQVDKESIAGHQGELRSGDQIIKINNHRVTSRDEAINLVNGACHILLQIVHFQVNCLPIIQSIPLTEHDNGVKSSNECNNLIKSCISLSSSTLNNNCLYCRRIQSYTDQFQYRRCLSLNDLRSCIKHEEKQIQYKKPLICSQSLLGITTDNEQIILKPFPFNNQSQQNLIVKRRNDSDSSQSKSNDSYHSHYNNNYNQWTLKHFRRRCREQRLKEQYQTTDDKPMSELKQGKYWTRQQRKEHLAKTKQYRQRATFFQQRSIIPYSDSATEDFNLLNHIFIQENQQELNEKLYLAYKYGQQSSIERNRLKRMIQQHYFNRIKSQSTRNYINFYELRELFISLCLTRQVDKRTLEKYQNEAREKSRESWYLSWALDTNEEEREKRKTIEGGRAWFETEKKHFIILDAPGHKCFVPNMIGGAAQADIAILVISTRKGEFETGFGRGEQT